MKNNGFTLVEILIALLIFSILMTLIGSSIVQVYSAQIRLTAADKSFMALEKTMLILERDIEQIVNRSVKNSIGRVDQGLEFNSRTKSSLNFTRAGVVSYSAEHRSPLQRVAYSVEQGALHRKTWNNLNPINSQPGGDQILLTNVTKMEWRFVDEKTTQYSLWPPVHQLAATLPRGILLRLKTSEGEMSRVFELPERSYVTTNR